MRIMIVGLALLGTAALAGQSSPPQNAGPVLYHDARLISGDGRAPIERGALLVESGIIRAAGELAGVEVPPTATRVDLSGTTVIPALVNAHVHLGYDRGLTFAAANFTYENVAAQLQRYAAAGVGTVLSLGTDVGDLAARVRREQESGSLGGAEWRSAGRGIAPPNAGPANSEMRPAAHGVTTVAEARAAVREEAARGVDIVKIWVDDRNGSVPKLSPELSRAVIDEAHQRGLGVVAHVFYLADARALVTMGVNGFAHLPRDAEVDAAFAAEMRRRDVFVLPNLAVSENGTHATPPPWLDDPMLARLVGSPELERLRGSYAARSPAAVERSRETYARMERSLRTLKAAGVRLGFASDAGAVRDHFHGVTDHRELGLMVGAGLSPAEALVAATSTSAAILGLDDRGVLAPGRRADFVVLERNPLENIANTRTIRAVYLRGTRAGPMLTARDYLAATPLFSYHRIAPPPPVQTRSLRLSPFMSAPTQLFIASLSSIR
jgi:imidazolonepropionase-like amidohydrolase